MKTGEKVSIGVGLAIVIYFLTREVMTYTVLGLKNNNPGNLEQSDSEWDGLTGYDTTTDGRVFCIFDTPLDGIRAEGINVLSLAHSGATTLYDLGEKWDPGTGYGSNLAGTLGVDMNVNYDFVSNLSNVCQAICKNENTIVPMDWPWDQGASLAVTHAQSEGWV